MPYDNPYNRQIANEIHNINSRYATLYAYSPVDGRDNGYAEGGSNAGVLFQMGSASKRDPEDGLYNDDLKLPPQYFYGNSAESMMGGSGFGEGSFRDTGYEHVDGASPVGVYEKGMGMSGGNLWTDIYSGFEDLGNDIGKATNYVFGSGRPQHFRVLGRMIGHHIKGKGMSGGSWWDSLKEGVSDVVGYIPEIAIHALGGADPSVKEVGGANLSGMTDRRAETERKIGGAILGNPDPYPVKGNSQRIAGRGRGRPKKDLQGTDGVLLAMPSPCLENGVPPRSQLRGSYGGAKPSDASVKEEVIKAVAKKMKGGKKEKEEEEMPKSQDVVHIDFEKGSLPKKNGGANLSGMTDKRIEMKGDGRKKRAEIVKKVMKEKGLKMIEASKYVKEHNLYKP